MYGSQMMQGQSEMQISLDITIPDPSELKMSGDAMESLTEFLSGRKYSWCSDEMLEKALQEKYPERFL